jgi:hypothetical protein
MRRQRKLTDAEPESVDIRGGFRPDTCKVCASRTWAQSQKAKVSLNSVITGFASSDRDLRFSPSSIFRRPVLLCTALRNYTSEEKEFCDQPGCGWLPQATCPLCVR